MHYYYIENITYEISLVLSIVKLKNMDNIKNCLKK